MARKPIKSNLAGKIDINMTPMIDVVFQLMSFFIMTFKIVSPEGDFNIKMPLGAAQGNPDPSATPPIKIRLEAATDGSTARISLANTGQTFASYKELSSHMINSFGKVAGPSSGQPGAEVELDCDYDLKYMETMKAISAVSGYIGSDKEIVRITDKLQFSQIRRPR